MSTCFFSACFSSSSFFLNSSIKISFSSTATISIHADSKKRSNQQETCNYVNQFKIFVFFPFINRLLTFFWLLDNFFSSLKYIYFLKRCFKKNLIYFFVYLIKIFVRYLYIFNRISSWIFNLHNLLLKAINVSSPINIIFEKCRNISIFKLFNYYVQLPKASCSCSTCDT
jgi:hypothetical protein